MTKAGSHAQSSHVAEGPGGVDRFIPASDGLRLHVRDYGPGVDPAGGAGAACDARAACPVVCLPGLARTADDFDPLARRLARRRRVVALDYRGRGLSDRDPDWRRYDLPVELEDIATALAALAIEQAIFVGTSRGGLHIMAIANLRPQVLRAAVLNDIGPVIETAGLERIRGYVGKLKQPDSWAEAIALFRVLLGDQFTAVTPAELAAYARATFEDRDGRLALRYDVNLMRNLAELDLGSPLPPLWPQFEALGAVPLLALRGENSDLLSQGTLEEMAVRHPRCETYVVPGQGHAPLLLDQASIGRIERFVQSVDPQPR